MVGVADWTGTSSAWVEELGRLKVRISGVFGRSELRATAGAFIDGLLSGAERKTGWMLAEEAGLEQPYRIQSLLGRSIWSAVVTSVGWIVSASVRAMRDPVTMISAPLSASADASGATSCAAAGVAAARIASADRPP